MSSNPEQPYPYDPYSSVGQPPAYGAQPAGAYPEPLAPQAPGGMYPQAYPQPGAYQAPGYGHQPWDPVMTQVQQMALISNQTRSNALGGWSLGLSIVGLLCCTYFVAQAISIGLGIGGLVAQKNNHANNSGMSIAGIVISVVSIFVWAGLLAAGLLADTTGY